MSNKQQRREFLTRGLALGSTLLIAGAGLPMCISRALASEAPQATPGGAKEKGLEDLAFCSLDCNSKSCNVYRATIENDLEEKKKIAAGWNKAFGVSIKPEEVACDGCRSKSNRLGYHCSTVCDVRKCGLSRGVKSCAVCADFPTCEKKLWKYWPEMHRRTEAKYRQMKKGVVS